MAENPLPDPEAAATPPAPANVPASEGVPAPEPVAEAASTPPSPAPVAETVPAPAAPEPAAAPETVEAAAPVLPGAGQATAAPAGAPPAAPASPRQPSAREREALQAAAARSRRSFIGLGLAGLAGVLGWRYLATVSPANPDADGLPRALRRVLDFNGRLTGAYYRTTRLAPEFARRRAQQLRTNGDVGLGDDFNPADWQLTVQGYAPAGVAARRQQFTLADIQALPRTEMTTEFKCIEGWSTIVHWAGARLADFLARYPLATLPGQALADVSHPPAGAAQYVGLLTPDEAYYVGLELWAALHPQTLLCYEMNGQPLTLAHGAPLRLVSPLKYGVKHLKRIGTIVFTDQRPADYWAELGYDWSGEH